MRIEHFCSARMEFADGNRCMALLAHARQGMHQTFYRPNKFGMFLVMVKHTCRLQRAEDFEHDPFLMFKVLNDKIQEIVGERYKSPVAKGDSFSVTVLALFRVIKWAAGLAQLAQKQLQTSMLSPDQLALTCRKLSMIWL